MEEEPNKGPEEERWGFIVTPGMDGMEWKYKNI